MLWRVGPDHEENDVTGKRRLSERLEKDVDFSAIRELAGGYCSQQRDPYATVLKEAIRRQINDGPVTTYTAGRSFSELPGDCHNVSASASQTKLAKFLAVFVVDTNNTRLMILLGN